MASLSARLPVGLDEPQALVDAAGDLGEDVGRVLVSHLRGLVDIGAHGLAERGQRRRQRLDMLGALAIVSG